jgi:hypothetical protein
MGAGIVPVSLNGDKLVFLFGKENKYNDTPGYSDFGGGREKNETNFQTAIREGSEELMGFIGNKNKIKKYLKQGKLSIVENNYEMFLFYYPYDEMLPYYFNNAMSYLEGFLPEKEIQTRTCFEKSSIKWMTIEELKKDRSKFRHFLKRHIDTIKKNEDKILSFVKNQQKMSN